MVAGNMETHNHDFDCCANEVYSHEILKIVELIVAPGRRTHTWFLPEASVEIRELDNQGRVIADDGPQDGVYAPNTCFNIDNRSGEMNCSILLLMNSPVKNFQVKHSKAEVEQLKAAKILNRIRQVTRIEKDAEYLPSFDGLSVCKFGAKWCKPCRESEQPYQTLYNSQNYAKVRFFSADVDFVPQLSANFEARQIPLFVGLRAGREVFRTHSVDSLPQLLHEAGIHQSAR